MAKPKLTAIEIDYNGINFSRDKHGDWGGYNYDYCGWRYLRIDQMPRVVLNLAAKIDKATKPKAGKR